MRAEDIRSFLVQRGVTFDERELQDAVQFRCYDGEVFNVYHTGTVVVGGRPSSLAEEVRKWSGASATVKGAHVADDGSTLSAGTGPDRTVFVVYGHDTAARDALELMLLKMDLKSIILQNLPAAGDTIIEKLEQYIGERDGVGYACVLLTPDDEGHLAGKVEEKRYRARQNVILELGMVLAKLGRRRVAVITKESVERPSYIAGLVYIPYRERVDEVKASLFRELNAAGYSPRTDVP